MNLIYLARGQARKSLNEGVYDIEKVKPRPGRIQSRRALLDERFDDLVEGLGLFTVAEMAGGVDDVHFRSGIAVGDDFEQRVAAFEFRRGVVVAPDDQGRLGELAVHDPAKRLFLVFFGSGPSIDLFL